MWGKAQWDSHFVARGGSLTPLDWADERELDRRSRTEVPLLEVVAQFEAENSPEGADLALQLLRAGDPTEMTPEQLRRIVIGLFE